MNKVTNAFLRAESAIVGMVFLQLGRFGELWAPMYYIGLFGCVPVGIIYYWYNHDPV